MSTMGTPFAKLWLGERGSWDFPDRIPKLELGNERGELDKPTQENYVI